jgi:hypothetical protein
MVSSLRKQLAYRPLRFDTILPCWQNGVAECPPCPLVRYLAWGDSWGFAGRPLRVLLDDVLEALPELLGRQVTRRRQAA